MHSPGINREGELRWQPANPGSPGKMAVKTDLCVCVCAVNTVILHISHALLLSNRLACACHV